MKIDNIVSIYNKVFKIGTLDKRSLALSRIFIGCLVVVDLLNRLRWLKAHYSDEGILPRSIIYQEFYYEYWFSFHFLSGRGWLELIIFLFHILFAITFLIGFKTKLSNFIVWLFVCSLQTRNILILHGGDVILRLILFYFIFLPSGEYFSVDAVIKTSKHLSENQIRKKDRSVLNFCSLALILQFCLMYYWNFYNKSGDTWHVTGMASYFALQLDYFRTFFGDFILYITPIWLFPVATFIVLWIEGVGFILFLMPFYSEEFRLIGTLVFMALHFIFLSSLAIEIFGWICIFGLIAFLPSLFWDKIIKVITRNHSPQLHIVFSKNPLDLYLAGFCIEILQIPISNFNLLFSSDTPKWSVKSVEEKTYTKFDSIIIIIKESFCFFLAPILSFKIVYIIFNYLFTKLQIYYSKFQPKEKKVKHIINEDFLNQYLPSPILALRQTRAFKLIPKRKHFFILLANIFVVYTIIFSYAYCDAESKNFSYFPHFYKIGTALRLDQRWAMFAPDPPQSQYYIIVPGMLQNGTMLELFRNGGMFNWEGSPFSRDKPPTFRDDIRSHRWAKLYESMAGHSKKEIIIEYYLNYVCREWNLRHHDGEKITQVTFELHYQDQYLNGTRSSPRKHPHPSVQCFINEH